jgi:ribosomal protein S18 acetylase RimI-like enzyme
MSKTARQFLREARSEGYSEDEVYDYFEQKYNLNSDQTYEAIKNDVTLASLRGEPEPKKAEPKESVEAGGMSTERVMSVQPEPQSKPDPKTQAPTLTPEGDVMLGQERLGSLPVSFAGAQEVAQAEGRSITPEEQAQMRMQTAGESFVPDPSKVATMTEPVAVEEVSRGAETKEEQEAFDIGRAMAMPLPSGPFAGSTGIDAVSSRLSINSPLYRAVKARRFDRQAGETLIDYGRRIRNQKELRGPAQELAERQKAYEDSTAGQRFFGKAGTGAANLARGFGGLTGAIAQTGKIAGTEGTFLLLSNLGLPSKVQENLEQQYNELQVNYEKHAAKRGGTSYKQGIDQTMQAMEKLQGDRSRREGYYGLWTNIADDIGDNIAGIGELASIISPSFIDLIRDIETGKFGVKVGENDPFSEKVAAAFQVGMAQGAELPGAAIGAMASIFANPGKALRAQPITTITTLLPIMSMMKAAGSASAGAMITKINKMAERAGVDLNNPDVVPSLDIPPKKRDQIIAQMRAKLRSGTGKAVDSRLARVFLDRDYIEDAAQAVATGKPLPKMRLKEGFTSPVTAAKLAAITYGVTEGDVTDTMLVLLPGAYGVAHAAQLRKIAGAKGASKFKSRKPVAAVEASVGRLFSNIATQVDRTGTLKATEYVDAMREALARGESDFIDVFNMIGRQTDPKDFDDLVNKAFAVRSDVIARVDADPEVKAAFDRLEAAKKAEAETPSVEAQAATAEAELEYRQLRTDTFAGEMDGINLLAEETGMDATVAALDKRRESMKEQHAARLERMEEEKQSAIKKQRAESEERVAKERKSEAVERRLNEVVGGESVQPVSSALAKAKKFKSLYQKKTKAHLMDDRYRVWDEGQTALFDEFADAPEVSDVHLEMLTVFRDSRGKGAGSKILKQITKMADEAGVTISLEAIPKGGSMSASELAKWYGRHGFEPHPDYDGLMVRVPSPTKPAKSGLAKLAGKKFGKWGQSVQGNIAFLDKLLEESQKATAAELDALVKANKKRVKAMMTRFEKGNQGAPLTNEQRLILKEINDSQLQLLDDYDNIKRTASDADDAIEASRQQYVEYLQDQRALAADNLEADLLGVRQRLEGEVAGRVERDVAKQATKQDERIARQKEKQDKDMAALEDDINTIDQERRVQKIEALESIMGEGEAAQTGVAYQSAPVVFDVKDQGKGAVGSFEYLTPDELADLNETGTLPSTARDRTIAPIDADTAQQRGLPFAERVQAINLFTPNDASVGLQALYRLSKDLASGEAGFAKKLDSLKGTAADLGGGRIAGAGGGVDLAKRFYLDTLGGLLFDNGNAAMLRSTALRKKFANYVREKLQDGKVLERGRRDMKLNQAAIEKLVNDYTFGRTRGSKFTVVDPVFQLARRPGDPPKQLAMSKMFGSFLNDNKLLDAPRFRLGRDLLKESRQDALTMLSQQLVSKLESQAASKAFLREYGTEGFLESTSRKPSARYLAEIVLQHEETGRLPFILRSKPPVLESALRGTKQQRAGAGYVEAPPNPAVVEAVARETGKTMTEAADMVRSAAQSLNRRNNNFVSWKKYGLPDYEQQQMSTVSAAESSAGILGPKLPVAGEDMAGHARLLGDLSEMYIDSNFGGTSTSTLGWYFMSTNMMNSSEFLQVLRNMSSSIKRNLTTQRPSTALTNVMSNVLAKMTRDGTTPDVVMTELTNNAMLWRKFTTDPESLPVAERGRLKQIFDQGLRSSNQINVEANLALDVHFSNAASRAANAVTTGWRRMPVIGGITKAADFVYQAGDAIFKLTDTRKMLRLLDQDVFDMSPGSNFTFVDKSQNNKVLGTVYRTSSQYDKRTRKMGAKNKLGNTKEQLGRIGESDDFVFPADQYEVRIGNRLYKGMEAVDKLEELKIKSAVGHANAMYFDYNVVPGYITLARNFDGLMFGPFKTWAWKSLDIPFIKKGIGTQTVFNQMPVFSTDPYIAARQYRRQSLRDMRRAAILLATRDSETEGNDTLRQMLPEWVAMSSWLEPGSYVAGSLGTRNFTIGLSNFVEFMQGMSESDSDKRIRELMGRKRPPHREIAKLLYDSGLVTGLFSDIMTSEDRYGRAIESKDLFPLIAQRMMPGWISTIGDTVSTVMSEGDDFYKYFSTYDKSLQSNQAVRYDIGSHLLRIWTGRRLQELDVDQAVKVINSLSNEVNNQVNKEVDKEKKRYVNAYGQDPSNWPADAAQKIEQVKTAAAKRAAALSKVFEAEAERLGSALSAKVVSVDEAKEAVKERKPNAPMDFVNMEQFTPLPGVQQFRDEMDTVTEKVFEK